MTLLNDEHQPEVDLFYFSGVFFLTNSWKNRLFKNKDT